MTTVNFVIHGEPASKANSRQIVTIRGRLAVIKSKKARDYVKLFDQQCKALPEMLEGDLAVIITVHYASRRPDLDESVILDCMQGKIYGNDRQVKEKHIFWSLDRESPRSYITVMPQDDRASIERHLRQQREG
jgi:Holliday junction resolvase RusA-like endonuclease